MAHILREATEYGGRVQVSHRDDGYVYFKNEADTSDKLSRLTEAEFDARYVDESTVRLEEGS